MKHIKEFSRSGRAWVTTVLSSEATRYGEPQIREYLKRIANSIEAQELEKEQQRKRESEYRRAIYHFFLR